MSQVHKRFTPDQVKELLRIPGHSGHPFRAIPDTYSI